MLRRKLSRFLLIFTAFFPANPEARNILCDDELSSSGPLAQEGLVEIAGEEGGGNVVLIITFQTDPPLQNIPPGNQIQPTFREVFEAAVARQREQTAETTGAAQLRTPAAWISREDQSRAAQQNPWPTLRPLPDMQDIPSYLSRHDFRAHRHQREMREVQAYLEALGNLPRPSNSEWRNFSYETNTPIIEENPSHLTPAVSLFIAALVYQVCIQYLTSKNPKDLKLLNEIKSALTGIATAPEHNHLFLRAATIYLVAALLQSIPHKSQSED